MRRRAREVLDPLREDAEELARNHCDEIVATEIHERGCVTIEDARAVLLARSTAALVAAE